MKINSVNNTNFEARIKIEKTDLTGIARKVSNIDNLSDCSLITTSVGSTASGLGSQTGALASGLHISAQTPESQSVPSFFAHSLPDSAWNFLQRFINPNMVIRDDATLSIYSSSLGTFLQRFAKSGMDWCEFTPKGKRSFPS